MPLCPTCGAEDGHAPICPDAEAENAPRGYRRTVVTGEPRNDTLRQMNVRVPTSMIELIDERRKPLSVTRDEWVRRVLEWALLQPPGTPVRARAAEPRRITAERARRNALGLR